jgi:acyl-CoA thioester hydrolase
MDLINTTHSKIRFSEVDPLGIVWHGHYVKYIEDGREAFGEEFNLRYTDFYQAGLIVPIVKVDLNYKKDVKYGDAITIETRYVDSPAAKIIFDYRILNRTTSEVVTTGSTTQVFLNKNRQLLLAIPPMFEQWKRQWNLIS